MQNSWIVKAISFVSAVGIVDAGYLTYEHFANSIPPCTIGGCESVLTSQYAEFYGVPISLLGLIFYVVVLILSFIATAKALKLLLVITSAAFAASLGLIYLQLFVIEAICIYCMVSAGLSTTLFILSVMAHRRFGEENLKIKDQISK